ncbi:MAG: glycerol-3-phosphate 1-O-acyltransferase PlsY [Candidatus Cloacimonetes bacterium]|nr:glycerol-3-phosphate 1-O-acyltransferase PlsY [Candidatus Cloacimonadota bacterium]
MLSNLVLIIVVSYLMGSVPFGYLLGKIIKRIDIREHGSGNVGATNVLRVLGWKIGLIAFLLDLLKGFGAVLFAKLIMPESSLIYIFAGLTAIVGHMFTIFLRFKGGKGVATSAGVFAALIPVSILIALLCFIVVTIISRYVSLSSIVAAIALIVVQSVFTFRNGMQNIEYLILVIIVAGFIVFKHKTNISRLINGTENKISFRSK